jgi:serine/threonine protein kinase
MTEASLPQNVLPRPIQFGKYHLLERVAVGGMAEVYKAKSFGIEGFERLIAVKKILPSIAEDAEFIRMFVHEAKLAGQLTHANIAQIFDLGRVEEHYFIAMEYVAGRDLRSVWERARQWQVRVPFELVSFIMSKVCEGLDYAHNKTDGAGVPLEIVHRDVSPHNVLLSYDGEVKIIDFGVAKAATSSGDTRVGILKGKLSYMSPEQVRGQGVDRRSDTFSAGIVLWELLTGERLFLGETDFETLEKIRKVEVAPPTFYNPDVPPELEDIVLRALQKNPARRYQTAHELQIDLQRFLFGRGVHPTGRDLSGLMTQLFEAEMTEERNKLEYFRTLGSEAFGVEAGSADLVWGDDESETQVFGRDENAPKIEVQSGVESHEIPFVPPAADIVYAEERPHRTGSQPSVRDSASRAAAEPPGTARILPVEERIPFVPPAVPASVPAPPPAPPVAAPRGAKSAANTGVMPRSGPTGQMAAAPSQTTGVMPAATPPTRKTPWLAIAATVLLLIAAAVFVVTRSAGAKQASLRLDLVPAGTTVTALVDGQLRHRGTVPHTIDGLEPGTHTLSVIAPGFEPLERSVTLTAGGTLTIDEPLVGGAATLAQISVGSEPAGARVLIDGVDRGTTPTSLEGLRPGQTYELRIEQPGFVPNTRRVTPTAGNNVISAVLAPMPIAEVADAGTDGSGASVADAGASPDTVAVAVVAPTTPPPAVPTTAPEREEEPREVAERDEPREEREPRAEPEEEPEPEVVAEPEQPPVPAGPPGRLSVQSNPAAQVFIDGDDTGRYTPLINFELPPGTYRVELVNEEFGLRRSYRVEIESGRTRTIINRPE